MLKTVLIVAATVVVADLAGNAIANKLTGPELTPTDKITNGIKIYGAKVTVGVATFLLLQMVSRGKGVA